jgi:hypothetical protein
LLVVQQLQTAGRAVVPEVAQGDVVPFALEVARHVGGVERAVRRGRA